MVRKEDKTKPEKQEKAILQNISKYIPLYTFLEKEILYVGHLKLKLINISSNTCILYTREYIMYMLPQEHKNKRHIALKK